MTRDARLLLAARRCRPSDRCVTDDCHMHMPQSKALILPTTSAAFSHLTTSEWFSIAGSSLTVQCSRVASLLSIRFEQPAPEQVVASNTRGSFLRDMLLGLVACLLGLKKQPTRQWSGRKDELSNHYNLY